MNFFEMLLMSKRMAFVDGAVTLYGQKVLIFPAPSMIDYVGMVGSDNEYARGLYTMAKEAMLEYKQDILSAYKPSDGMDWVINTINLYGLGKITYQNTGAVPAGVLVLSNSPFAKNLKGKINTPIDHILRGILAGMASVTFNRNLDVIETECGVTGTASCKLILDSKENLLAKFPSLFGNQI